VIIYIYIPLIYLQKAVMRRQARITASFTGSKTLLRVFFSQRSLLNTAPLLTLAAL
jgi:hypothetical protein